jgi:hypothetical protein
MNILYPFQNIGNDAVFRSTAVLKWAMAVTPFNPVPAVGDAFIGREGLVKNLRGRIARNESLAVIGGPKLGKTSLVRTALQGLPERRVIELDLSADPISSMETSNDAIMFLDNLDTVAEPEIEPLLERISAAGVTGIVATGGRRLRDLLGRSGILVGRSFRLFPLSVLLDGETKRLIGNDADPSLAEWSGNHPYLTKLLLHYLKNSGNRCSPEEAVAMSRHTWEPFVQRLSDEIGKGPERRLLLYLIERGKPVSPTLAKAESGIEAIKPVADTLTYLGAIQRWVRNEEATLHAGCRMLNDFITA